MLIKKKKKSEEMTSPHILPPTSTIDYILNTSEISLKKKKAKELTNFPIFSFETIGFDNRTRTGLQKKKTSNGFLINF